jgi:hypothetical protein
MIFYTNNFIAKNFAGCTRGPFIFIRPEYRNDAGMLAHEKVHVRQWFRTLGIHPLLYALSNSYKLRCEVEAYREQAKYDADDCSATYAGYLSELYGFNITKEEALRKLQGK